MILPSAFIYTTSGYNKSDKRRLKYWLPNGLMQNFQNKNYGTNFKSGDYSGFVRAIRWILPFGYILWWDSAVPDSGKKQQTVSQSASAPDNAAISRIEKGLAALRKESENNARAQRELAERIEIEILKLAVEIKELDL